MRFWDSSALVPLLVRQARTQDMHAVLAEDAEIVAWWGTPIECLSALARLGREGHLMAGDLRAAEQRLRQLRDTWEEVLPGEACRRNAERMLRVHPLRAGDALQLAAATVAAEHEPGSLEMVCLDQRLSEAARKEGFPLVVGT